MIMSGLSGLLKAYRSVLSAKGSLEINGASRWLEAMSENEESSRNKKVMTAFPFRGLRWFGFIDIRFDLGYRIECISTFSAIYVRDFTFGFPLLENRWKKLRTTTYRLNR